MIRLLFCLLFLASSLAADPGARVDQAFRAWMADHGVKRGALVLLQNGQEIRHVGQGRDTGRESDIQSLSKAITAQCVAALVDEGRLRWNDPVSRHTSYDSRLTLAALVTHRSGLWPDETQGAMAQREKEEKNEKKKRKRKKKEKADKANNELEKPNNRKRER